MALVFSLSGSCLSTMLSYIIGPELMPRFCAVCKVFALAAANPAAWEACFIDTRGLRPVGPLARGHYELWSLSWVVAFAEWMTRSVCFLKDSEFSPWWWRRPRPRLHVFPSRIVLRSPPPFQLWNDHSNSSILMGTPLRRGPSFKIGVRHGGAYPEEMAICLSDTEELCEIAGCYTGEPAITEEDAPPVLLAALFEKGVFSGFAFNGERIGSSTNDAAVSALGPETVLALSCCGRPC